MIETVGLSLWGTKILKNSSLSFLRRFPPWFHFHSDLSISVCSDFFLTFSFQSPICMTMSCFWLCLALCCEFIKFTSSWRVSHTWSQIVKSSQKSTLCKYSTKYNYSHSTLVPAFNLFFKSIQHLKAKLQYLYFVNLFLFNLSVFYLTTWFKIKQQHCKPRVRSDTSTSFLSLWYPYMEKSNSLKNRNYLLKYYSLNSAWIQTCYITLVVISYLKIHDSIETSIEAYSKSKKRFRWDVKHYLKQQNCFFSNYYREFLKFLYTVLSSLFVIEYLIHNPYESSKYLEVTV